MASRVKPQVEAVLGLHVGRADVPWELQEGRAVLIFRKRYGWFEGLLARLVNGPSHVRVTLDELGTETWLAADGARTLQGVADRLRERFGEAAEPAEARAYVFVENLTARGLLRYTREPAPAADALKGLTPERGFTRVACPRCKSEATVHRDDAGKRFVCPRCGRLRKARAG